MKFHTISRTLLAAVCASAFLVCSPVMAQTTAPATGATASASFKIGFINTERVLKDSTLAKAAQQKLEAEFSKRDKELQDMAAKIKATKGNAEFFDAMRSGRG